MNAPQHTETFSDWEEFLDAVRNSEIRFEHGAYARVEYDTPYSEHVQTIEDEIESASKNALGKPFYVDGKKFRRFCVWSGGREIGQVREIEMERRE